MYDVATASFFVNTILMCLLTSAADERSVSTTMFGGGQGGGLGGAPGGAPNGPQCMSHHISQPSLLCLNWKQLL